MVEVEEEGTPPHGRHRGLCDGVNEKGVMDDVDHTGLGNAATVARANRILMAFVPTLHFSKRLSLES